MDFWKMNGAGNDFILVNNLEEKIPEECFPEMARILCERHLSLGADGFMVIERPAPGVEADFRMLFFNSDGSLGEMCGNGARCIARYGYETGLSGVRQVVETTAGIVTGERISEELYRIRLNDPGVIRLDEVLEISIGQCGDGQLADPVRGFEMPGASRHGDYEGDRGGAGAELFQDAGNGYGLRVECSYIELGDPGIPHIVVRYGGILAGLCGSARLADADERVLREIGRRLRYHSSLPRGANVNFVEITGQDEALIRTYERGVEDFTYACGTGTGSAALALTLKGLLGGSGMTFNMRGGKLIVDIEETDEYEDGEVCAHSIMLTGPTNIVARGELLDSALAGVRGKGTR